MSELQTKTAQCQETGHERVMSAAAADFFAGYIAVLILIEFGLPQKLVRWALTLFFR